MYCSYRIQVQVIFTVAKKAQKIFWCFMVSNPVKASECFLFDISGSNAIHSIKEKYHN